MSLKFVNRICPNCKNPNYMVLLGDASKTHKYKCMNCNVYLNDFDFEEEPLQPVWKRECMNAKVDMVEVVRCKDCRHWWKENELCTHEKTMDGNVCCLKAKPDFYCGYGESR